MQGLHSDVQDQLEEIAATANPTQHQVEEARAAFERTTDASGEDALLRRFDARG
jgi:hypothetical protein